MNLEARVDKLERDNKTLKKMLGGVAALALAALIGGTVMGVHAAKNGSFDRLVVKTLYLIDSSGRTVLALRGKDRPGVGAVIAGGNLDITARNIYLKDSSRKKNVVLRGSDGYIQGKILRVPHRHKGKTERKASHTHSLTVN